MIGKTTLNKNTFKTMLSNQENYKIKELRFVKRIITGIRKLLS